MNELEHKCYWNDWANNKIESLSIKEALENKEISKCTGYLGKFYSGLKEDLK